MSLNITTSQLEFTRSNGQLYENPTDNSGFWNVCRCSNTNREKKYTNRYGNIHKHLSMSQRVNIPPCVKFESRQENPAETKLCNLVVTPTKVNVG